MNVTIYIYEVKLIHSSSIQPVEKQILNIMVILQMYFYVCPKLKNIIAGNFCL